MLSYERKSCAHSRGQGELITQGAEEIDLASGLIKKLSSEEFQPEPYAANIASGYLPCSRKNERVAKNGGTAAATVPTRY
jgi:hypothetical protein